MMLEDDDSVRRFCFQVQLLQLTSKGWESYGLEVWMTLEHCALQLTSSRWIHPMRYQVAEHDSTSPTSARAWNFTTHSE